MGSKIPFMNNIQITFFLVFSLFLKFCFDRRVDTSLKDLTLFLFYGIGTILIFDLRKVNVVRICKTCV